MAESQSRPNVSTSVTGNLHSCPLRVDIRASCLAAVLSALQGTSRNVLQRRDSSDAGILLIVEIYLFDIWHFGPDYFPSLATCFSYISLFLHLAPYSVPTPSLPFPL